MLVDAMITCKALMEHLEGVPFPASKEELVAFLQKRAAPAAAVWMMEHIPGRDFRFATDVENTVRLAHELRLDEPWEGEEESREALRISPAEGAEIGRTLPSPSPSEGKGRGRVSEHPADESLAQVIRERLHRCRSTNAWLIRVRVEGRVATLEGRVTDVPQGILAAKVAQGVPGVRWVINNLDVAT